MSVWTVDTRKIKLGREGRFLKHCCALTPTISFSFATLTSKVSFGSQRSGRVERSWRHGEAGIRISLRWYRLNATCQSISLKFQGVSGELIRLE